MHNPHPEKKIRESTVYEGALFRVKRAEVALPGGETAVREYVEHSGGATVVALTADNHIVLVRQWRVALEAPCIELPAGKADGKEDRLTVARRELREETGLSAGCWDLLANVHLTVGYSSEQAAIFLARNLQEGERDPDPDEHLEVLRIPLAEAIDWIWAGKISSALTIAGILLARDWLSQAGVPGLENAGSRCDLR